MGESSRSGRDQRGSDVLAAGADGTQKVNALVGNRVRFNGILRHKGTIRIDGRLEGEVYTEGILLVGEQGVVKAKIRAGAVLCKGAIAGDVIARERIGLFAPAIVEGTLTTPRLSVEEGVRLDGGVTMSVRDHEISGEIQVEREAWGEIGVKEPASTGWQAEHA